MDLVHFIWSYLRRHVGWCVVALVAVAVFGVTSAAAVAMIGPIFEEVLLAGDPSRAIGEAAPATQFAIPDGLNLKRMADEAYARLKDAFHVTAANVHLFTPLLFLAVFLVRSLAAFFSGYAFQRVGLGLATDIRNDVHWRLLEQSSRFHGRHTSGELVSRVVNDVSQLEIVFSSRVYDILQQGVVLVLLLVLLLSTDLKLALMGLALAPFIVVTAVRFGSGVRRTSRRSQERMADVAGLLTETVRGHRVVKAFGMEAFEHERFTRATRRHLRVNLRATLLLAASSPVIETIATLGSAVFLIYAGVQIREGTITAPLLLQFMGNLLLMYDPIRKLNKANLTMQQALAAVHRLRDIMTLPNEIEERAGARTIDGVRTGVSFEHVNFGYDDRTVLDDVSLSIARGEMVALVGPSGGGKSTLVNLLPRFFDPDEGRVTIDGRDIRDITLKSLRSMIGIVTQETVLFNDTVRNNIAYGRSDLPLERVREAARTAYADRFINELPEGYDTVIGEGGSRLSGGQRQRLAIARALLKDAPVLILDEATSHLDSESESLIQRALANLTRGRTTLVIAHRMSTVTEADRIVVMDAGRVVEQGTHERLLASGGTYRRLVELQDSSASLFGSPTTTEPAFDGPVPAAGEQA